MKKRIALLLSLLLMVSVFSGCSLVLGGLAVILPNLNPSAPTEAPTEPEGPQLAIPEGAELITIAQALELCEQFVDAPSAERYYIRATIKSIDDAEFGQMTITDETGSMMVYGSASADGSLRYDAMPQKPDAGDEVLLYGTLQNYKGNTKEVQNGWIIDFVHKELPVPELPAFDSTLTIAELLTLPIADGQVTEGRYYVRGTVQSVTNAQYGAMLITDGKDSISVYGSYSKDGSVGYASMEQKPVKGDEVLLYTNVKNFKGTIELNSAWIQEFTPIEIDETAYTAMSIAAARQAEIGTKIKTSGVVAAITYANGKIPSGVILVDNTGSIYVYDGDLAAGVSVGNQITVVAEKDYWILDTEKSNAQKFGYAGCNQLTDGFLISNDEGNATFDKSWIKTSTVKDIIDTPVTTDISTEIFKVTAQVKKVPGNGFVNYYFFDLDGKTGTYTYTQCNGSDFVWLDEFDGKICTVYLTALNAKSTASDCYWRLLPVSVVDEGFDPATVNIPENAVKYYGVTQFLKKYTGNPALELLTTVNNELLGYTGVTLSYTSSDPSVISIDDNVMNCISDGTTKITVTATHNGVSYSEDVTIEVAISEDGGEYVTVKDAIDAAVGETVEVKGIVGPSLVNKVGFYLIDETGVIAVLTESADVLSTLEIGNEVVLSATRTLSKSQTCLSEATVVVNNYGKHDYPTKAFKGEISVADFVKLAAPTDYTTNVYLMTATVKVVPTAYSTNVYLTDGTNEILLYASNGATQYEWIANMKDEEITVEIAPCDWNSKGYKGCVLAVINADGTKTVNTLNFN